MLSRAGALPFSGANRYHCLVRYITGFHGILESIKSGQPGAKLCLSEGRDARKKGPRARSIVGLAEKAGIVIEKIGQAELDRIDPDNKGIALALPDSPGGAETDFDKVLDSLGDEAVAVILDHIEDPQNLGAILRSADAFGVDLVVSTARRSAPLTEAAVRASAGAAAWVRLCFVPNLADALRRLKDAGFWVFSAEMDGRPLPGAELPAKTCFILGNEGSGVSRLLSERSDGKVSIPMGGHVDSLNVSVAAALCMYEYRRARPLPTDPRYP